MIVKIHNSYRNIVSICDEDLLGEKFEEGKKQLDVRESFFRGDNLSEKEVKDIIESQDKEDATFNIVGENSINIALEYGIIKEECIKKVEDIPFALVFL